MTARAVIDRERQLMSTPEHSPRFGMTSEALFVTDDGGRIKHWNEGARRLTGYSEVEVLGKRCYSVLCGRRGGRSWCQADCCIRRSVRRGTLPTHVSLEVRSRDGSRIPVAVTFLVQKERSKKVIAHLMQDDSRQDQLRKTVREARRLLQGVEGDPSEATASSELPARPAPERGATVDLSILTRRELEVLRLMTEGLSTEAIGDRLGVSRLTARNHIQNALKRLGLRTRTQAVVAVLQQAPR